MSSPLSLLFAGRIDDLKLRIDPYVLNAVDAGRTKTIVFHSVTLEGFTHRPGGFLCKVSCNLVSTKTFSKTGDITTAPSPLTTFNAFNAYREDERKLTHQASDSQTFFAINTVQRIAQVFIEAVFPEDVQYLDQKVVIGTVLLSIVDK